MSKLSLATLLILLPAAFCARASARYDACYYLSVHITNSTETNCRHVSTTVQAGELVDSEEVPSVILPHKTATPFLLMQTQDGVQLELTYACGSQKRVTFSMHQQPCISDPGIISCAIRSTENMHALCTIAKGSLFWGRQGRVYWQLLP